MYIIYFLNHSYHINFKINIVRNFFDGSTKLDTNFAITKAGHTYAVKGSIRTKQTGECNGNYRLREVNPTKETGSEDTTESHRTIHGVMDNYDTIPPRRGGQSLETSLKVSVPTNPASST